MTIDASAYIAATRATWDRTAAGWNANTARIHQWLSPATAQMLDAAGIVEGARVLDVAAGAGDQTLDIARRVGPTGRVIATDLSPEILAFAQANARAASLPNIEFIVADAENLDLGTPLFNAAVCRLGLMFCLDPSRALRAMHNSLAPGGRASVLVFASAERNPCIGILGSVALAANAALVADPYRPGSLLSLGKPGAIDAAFAAAGFGQIKTIAIDAPFKTPLTRDYVNFVRSAGGPILEMIERLDRDAQLRAWRDMETKLGVFQGVEQWVGPHELLLTVGTKIAV